MSVPAAYRDRVDRARQVAPELIADNRWLDRLVDDPEFVAAVIREMMRLDQGPAQRGSRTTPDPVDGMRRWREITRTDYSVSTFPVAFAALIAGDSQRDVEARTGISKSRVGRLLGGEEEPALADITAIAAAYDVSPWWFHQYRVHVITGAVTAMLEENPELAIVIITRHTRP